MYISKSVKYILICSMYPFIFVLIMSIWISRTDRNRNLTFRGRFKISSRTLEILTHRPSTWKVCRSMGTESKEPRSKEHRSDPRRATLRVVDCARIYVQEAYNVGTSRAFAQEGGSIASHRNNYRSHCFTWYRGIALVMKS